MQEHNAQYTASERIQGGTLVGVTLVVFALLAGVLSALDFVPEPRTADAGARPAATSASAQSANTRPQEEAVQPVRIIVDAIDVDARIVSPKSREVAVLDEALLDGVVQYPGSGTLADESNMLLFGHSSSLPVVHNQNFKVFNDLKELKRGQIIRVQSQTHEHVYRVTGVRLTEADEALVRFGTGKKQLTLSTCNSFGAKSERYVVEADFVGRYRLDENA